MGTSRSDARPFAGPWAAAALVPLACGPWLRDQYILPKIAAAAVCVAGGLAWAAARGGLLSLASRADGALAGFCAAAAFSSLRSIDPRLSWFGHDMEYLFSMAGVCGLVGAYYVGCALGRAGLAQRAVVWLAAGSLPVSAYAWIQGSGWEILGPQRLPEGRGAISTFGSPVFLGAYLALIIPLSLFLWRSTAHRRLAVAVLALALGALALTASRGAWAAAAGGAGFFWIFLRGGSEKSPRTGRLRAALLALAVLAAGAALTRLRAGAVQSDSARLRIWRIAAEEFAERPWAGWGMDTFIIGFRQRKDEALARLYVGVQVQSHAHNDWLQVLATMGLLGAACYAWLHVAAWRGIRARLRSADPGSAAAAAAAVFAAVVMAKTNSPSFGVAWLAALLAGCALWEPAPARGARRLLAPGLALACSGWFLYASVRMTAADRQDWDGRRARAAGAPREAADRYERAIALNPGTIAYRIDLVNVLHDAAQALADLDSRRLLLDRAAAVAADGVRARPLDAEAHRILGLAQMRRALWGKEDTLDLARRSLENALVLDPYYARTAAELRKVALLQGDTARGKEMEDRLRRLGLSYYIL